MIAGAEDEADGERRHHRPAAAEGQIAEQVEDDGLAGIGREEVIEHRRPRSAAVGRAGARAAACFACSSWRSMASMIGAILVPSEPLTSTTSPGRSSLENGGDEGLGIRRVRAAPRRRQSRLQELHQRPAGEHEIDAGGDDGGREIGMEGAEPGRPARAYRPARRCAGRFGPGSARASTAKAARIAAGLAL